ncbi:MAG: hypothetical protein MUC31_03460 [Bacteroidales bacterium]|jgi:hypothetical protein|nr:hypothetical protein [Bacteroidales bacterium]
MKEKISGLNTALALVLLTCLFLPFAGSYLFFDYRAKTIKKEVSALILQGIREELLVNMTFSLTDADKQLNWKHAREFEYDGRMYDIVRSAAKGDSITYTCFRDHKETRLYQQKQKSIAKALGHDPLQKKQNERLRNFFSNFFVQQNQAANHILSFLSLSHYALNIKHYALVYIIPPSPPPKIV